MTGRRGFSPRLIEIKLDTKKGTERIMIVRNRARGPKAFPLYAAICLTVALCATLALSVGAQSNNETQLLSQVVSEKTVAPSDDFLTQHAQAQLRVGATMVPKTESVSPSASQILFASEVTTSTTAAHPASYEWTCGADYGGIAPDDGSLSEWAPHYYVAHSYGPYGEAILGLEQGDTVTVNGVAVTVEGAVIMPQLSAYEDVMDCVGWDATVFQTCVPDSDDCRFVYARGASSTAAAADEARRWAGLGIDWGMDGGAPREMPHAPDAPVPPEPGMPGQGVRKCDTRVECPGPAAPPATESA